MLCLESGISKLAHAIQETEIEFAADIVLLICIVNFRNFYSLYDYFRHTFLSLLLAFKDVSN